MSQLIFKKMSDVMKEIGFVGKDQKNTVQGFKFRGIDQFVNALYPALCKHGVFMTPRCINESHELKEVERSSGKRGVDKHVHIMMEYDFFAEDGSKVTVGPMPAEGLDSGDKATNKAMSAALKYALIQAFSVPTEDMAEADLDSPEINPAPKEIPAKPSFAEIKNKKPELLSNTPKMAVSTPTNLKPLNVDTGAELNKDVESEKKLLELASQKTEVTKTKPVFTKSKPSTSGNGAW